MGRARGTQGAAGGAPRRRPSKNQKRIAGIMEGIPAEMRQLFDTPLDEIDCDRLRAVERHGWWSRDGAGVFLAV